MPNVSIFSSPNFLLKEFVIHNLLQIRLIFHYYRQIRAKFSGLSNQSCFDNVLHIRSHCSALCNTLSRGVYARSDKCQSKTDFRLQGTKVLDDRAPFPVGELLDPVGATILGQRRILQQFYAQRTLVHSCFHSALRARRALVSRGDRFFQRRVIDPDPCQVDRTQPGGNDSGSTRRKAPMPLPCRLGAVISKGPGATAKTRPLIRISGRRSGHGLPSAANPSETQGALVAGGDGGSGPCGIHSLSGGRIPATGQCGFPTHGGGYKSRSGSSAFRAARGKKTA